MERRVKVPVAENFEQICKGIIYIKDFAKLRNLYQRSRKPEQFEHLKKLVAQQASKILSEIVDSRVTLNFENVDKCPCLPNVKHILTEHDLLDIIFNIDKLDAVFVDQRFVERNGKVESNERLFTVSVQIKMNIECYSFFIHFFSKQLALVTMHEAVLKYDPEAVYKFHVTLPNAFLLRVAASTANENRKLK